MIRALVLCVGVVSALDYDERIDTTLSTSRLFQLLHDSLENSSVADSIWPTQYSVISGTVEEGGEISETIEGSVTYTYDISNVSAGEEPFHLNYSPVAGSALSGHSMIEVLPQEAGSYIRWYGHCE